MVTTNSTESVVELTTAATDGQPTPTPADVATQTAESATPTTENAAETKTTATDGQPTPATLKEPKQKEATAELTRLTKQIKGHLDTLACSIRKTTEIAYQIGLKLKEVKKLVTKAGDSWQHWVKDNLKIEKRQTQKYMRLADCWVKLKAEGHNPANMTIEQCLAVLAKPNGPIPGVEVVKSKEVAAVKPTANGFKVSGTSQLNEKKGLAGDLLQSEQFFAKDSEQKKFVADKLAALVRQIRQVAQKISKSNTGNTGPESDAVVLAIALSNKLASELRTLPVVEVVEATAEQTPLAEVSRPHILHDQMNGFAPVLV